MYVICCFNSNELNPSDRPKLWPASQCTLKTQRLWRTIFSCFLHLHWRQRTWLSTLEGASCWSIHIIMSSLWASQCCVWCAWWWQRFCSTSGRHQKQLSSGSHEPRDISCHSRCYVHCSVAKLGWHMNLLQMPFRLLRQETSTAQLPCRLKHESYEHTIDHERSMYWQITEEWLAHLSVQPVSQRGIDHYLPSKRLINHFRRNHQTE